MDASTTTLVGEKCTHEGAQHLTREFCIPGASVTQGIRQCENPLAHGRFGQNAIHEMGGRVGHAPSATRGAQSPSFATESQQAITAASVAV
jgi:hypothetical protein